MYAIDCNDENSQATPNGQGCKTMLSALISISLPLLCILLALIARKQKQLITYMFINSSK